MGRQDQTISEEENIRKQIHEARESNEKLEELIGFGKFQWIQIIGFLSFLCTIAAFDLFQNAFNVESGHFRCKLPENLEKK